jgi:hypothetical protein
MGEEAYWRTCPGGLSSIAFSFPGEPLREAGLIELQRPFLRVGTTLK